MALADSSACCSWKRVARKAGLLPHVERLCSAHTAIQQTETLIGWFIPQYSDMTRLPVTLPGHCPTMPLHLSTCLVSTTTPMPRGGCPWLCLPSPSRTGVLEDNPRNLLVSLLPSVISSLVHVLVIQQGPPHTLYHQHTGLLRQSGKYVSRYTEFQMEQEINIYRRIFRSSLW